MKLISVTLLSLAMSFGLSAQAALVDAGGNVILVSTSVIASPAGIGAASDGITTLPTDGQLYTDDRNGGSGGYFVGVSDPLVFDIDLGSAYTLDSIAFFNRDSNPNGNALREFSALFSLDANFGGSGDLSTGPFIAANSGPNQQDFAISTVAAQYVRISVTDNYFGIGGGGGGDRVGFNEFQFNEVPEPSSLALLGLASLGMLVRRKR